jgi:hypothetical protein
VVVKETTGTSARGDLLRTPYTALMSGPTYPSMSGGSGGAKQAPETIKARSSVRRDEENIGGDDNG